jgi:hypothetical protein
VGEEWERGGDRGWEGKAEGGGSFVQSTGNQCLAQNRFVGMCADLVDVPRIGFEPQ